VVDWTQQQLDAINWQRGEVVVSASAGSGKTAVLIQRCLKLITDPSQPCPVDRLLVVTFTEAAADQLRQRLTAELQKLASEAGAAARANLQRQLMLIDTAAICTIHAFCYELVSRHFHCLGISPAVQVLEAEEAVLLKHEVLDEVFEQYYQRDDQAGSAFRQLARLYGGADSDRRLADVLLALHEFVESLAWPEEWIDRCRAAYCNPSSAAWSKLAAEQIADQIDQAIQALRSLRTYACRNGLDQWAEKLAQLDQLWTHWMQLAQECKLSELAGALNSPYPKMPSVRKDAPPEAAFVRDQRRAIDKRLRETGLLADLKKLGWQCLVGGLEKVSPHALTLLDALQLFQSLLNQRKRRMNRLEFADQQRLALKLLLDETSRPGRPVPSDIARKYRNKFRFVLVDEYQDVNELQDTIIRLVCRHHESGAAENLFVVGDVKQSIYRFRLAEPRVFQQRCQLAAQENSPLACIPLSKNFRSREQVLAAVNALFDKLMDSRFMELDYSRHAHLQYGADYPPLPAGHTSDHTVELHLVERRMDQVAESAGGDSDSDEPSDQPRQAGAVDVADLESIKRQAVLVATRVKELLDQKLLIKSQQGYRPIQPGDIAILLRSIRHTANVFQQMLARQGIASYCASAGGFLDYPEVTDILSLLQVIDNPDQDIPLAAVLRSPIVGLDVEELATIRQADRSGGFYQAVLAFLGDESADRLPWTARLRAFWDHLDHWRSLAHTATVAELIEEIYLQTRYTDYVAGATQARQRYQNLQVLYQLACKFSRFAQPDLAAFLRYLEDLQASGQELTVPAGQDSENAVRILSIHASKGLEFPVCIVANLGKRFNLESTQGDILFHREALLAMRHVDPTRPVKNRTLAGSIIAQRLRNESLAEELRLLYVALTRAREKLILVGNVQIDSLSKHCLAYRVFQNRQLPGNALLGASSMLDWILAALADHTDFDPLFEHFETDAASQSAHCPFGSRFNVRYHSAEDQRAWELDHSVTSADSESTALLDAVKQGRPAPLAEDDQLRAIVAAVTEPLLWQYPHPRHGDVKAKFAVTEFKGPHAAEAERLEEDALPMHPVIGPELFRWPDDPARQAAARGTAIHKFLQHVDLASPLDLPGLTDQLQTMVAKGRISQHEATLIDLATVEQFFAGELGRLMKDNHQHLQREVQFCYALPLHKLPQPWRRDSDDLILIKGVIDCLIRTSTGLVILDYKTDRIAPEQIHQRTEIYRNQVQIYIQAMHAILRQEVIAAYLHFLHIAQTVRL